MKHQKNKVDFLDNVDYCFELITSSFRLLGSLRDDKVCEDDLYSFSLAIHHFTEPILEKIKDNLHAYNELLEGKKDEK